MADTRITPHEILLPVKPGFIPFTLIVGLLLNLLPWSGALLWLRPDFVALVLLFTFDAAVRRCPLVGSSPSALRR